MEAEERRGRAWGCIGFDDACLPATYVSDPPLAAAATRSSQNRPSMADYQAVHALHRTLPSFSPSVPVGLLPYLAFLLLAATFVLAFYFSTLPTDKVPIREVAVASLASILAGFGVVAMFCTVGVYV